MVALLDAVWSWFYAWSWSAYKLQEQRFSTGEISMEKACPPIGTGNLEILRV